MGECDLNAYQLLQQLKFLIQSARWPDEPRERVIKSTYATSGLGSEEVIGQLGFPYAMLKVGSAIADTINPFLMRQEFTLSLGVSIPGDVIGEPSLIGGRRSGAGSGSSMGRGLLEIEEEVLNVIARLGDEVGVNIRCTSKSATEAVMLQDMTYISARDYNLECWSTVKRYYHPPRDLTLAGDTLTWRNPALRFDSVSLNGSAAVMVRKRTDGVPPTDPSDGVEVGQTSSETLEDSSAGPNDAYTAFGIYDEAIDSQEIWLRYSDPDRGSTWQ